MRRVYIAGPISKGDQFTNVRNAILAADRVRDLGYAPFVPHLTCFWHLLSCRDYEDWMSYDYDWLEVCDCLIRLPGESPGADREVAYAKQKGKPVFAGVETFAQWHWHEHYAQLASFQADEG